MYLEIKEKRPIRHGGLVLLGILIFVIGEPIALIKAVDILRHAYPSSLALLQAFVTITSTWSALLLVIHFLRSSFEHNGERMAGPLAGLLWLQAYWHRNVVGYEIWCVYLPDSSSPPHIIYLRESWRNPVIERGFAIILPLGGWFNRPQIVCSQSYRPNKSIKACEELAKWRVELVAICVETKAIIVRLEDRQGDRIQMSVENALQVLNEFAAQLKAWSNTWGAILSSFIIDKECGARKLAELQAKLDEQNAKALEQVAALGDLKGTVAFQTKETLTLIETAIQRLDGTKRFINSKQAQAIREWLVEELFKRIPADDHRRETYASPKRRVRAADNAVA